jgi:hypothetical protein
VDQCNKRNVHGETELHRETVFLYAASAWFIRLSYLDDLVAYTVDDGHGGKVHVNVGFSLLDTVQFH